MSYLSTETASSTLDLRESGASSMCSNSELSISNSMPGRGGKREREKMGGRKGRKRGREKEGRKGGQKGERRKGGRRIEGGKRMEGGNEG